MLRLIAVTWQHVASNVFVFTTGIAAFVHSTWALGTFFAGPEPEQGTGAWLAWAIPAMLIAFALDIGQINTAGEIKNGNRSAAKYATFAILAIATYYLQFLYIAHHMPALELAVGIGHDAQHAAAWLRDAAIWVLPALMPLATVMYTLSGTHETQPVSAPEAEPLIESSALAVTDTDNVDIVVVAPAESTENEDANSENHPFQIHVQRDPNRARLRVLAR